MNNKFIPFKEDDKIIVTLGNMILSGIIYYAYRTTPRNRDIWVYIDNIIDREMLNQETGVSDFFYIPTNNMVILVNRNQVHYADPLKHLVSECDI